MRGALGLIARTGLKLGLGVPVVDTGGGSVAPPGFTFLIDSQGNRMLDARNYLINVKVNA